MQEAFEITLWVAGSYFSSFTPITIVMSSPLAGALMMTFCGARLEVLRGLLAVGEQARGLDHDLGAQLLPGQVRRVALGEHPQLLAVHDEAVAVGADLAVEPAQHRVVLQQVRQGRRRR